MRPSKTIKYVAALSTNKVALESIKLWVEIIGLIAVLLTLGCYVWLAFLQKDANEISRQAMAANQKSLELNQKSLALAQQSIDITQKSLDLNQQSVKAAQEALALTEKANEISQQGIATANTPWIDVRIINISYTGNHAYDPTTADLPPYNGIIASTDGKGHSTNASLDIHYSLENHSDSPAKHVYVYCFLKNGSSYAAGFTDREALADDSVALMPKQVATFTASMLSEGRDPREMIKLIEQSKVGVKIYVFYFDALKHKTSFIETFYNINGIITLTNTEFDPPESEIEDMLYERDTSKKNKK
jgi:hypothetical protein